MNIFFRTDSSIDIGTGHVIRCLTLADALRQREVNVSFICREEQGNLISHIERSGYKVHHLQSGIDIEEDRKLTEKIIAACEVSPDWLIIDHYDIDISWETSLRKFVKKIMVIDDLANRRHNCDLLLDQNYSSNGNRYDRLVPDNCIKFFGPTYALLRPQFQKIRENLKERNSEIKRILVFMGGVDPTNETCKVLRAIKMLERPNIAIDVVVGSSNPHQAEIEAFVSTMPNTICHVNVDNMAELMALADLCIGAGGTTTWERCCLGLPSIVMILAENQRKIAESLSREEVIVNLGWFEDVKETDIRDALKNLANNLDFRRSLSIKGCKIVDGRGVERVSQMMIGEHAL